MSSACDDVRWYEFAVGRGCIQVLAADEVEAADRAERELRGIGVLPGPMREAWVKLCEGTRNPAPADERVA